MASFVMSLSALKPSEVLNFFLGRSGSAVGLYAISLLAYGFASARKGCRSNP